MMTPSPQGEDRVFRRKMGGATGWGFKRGASMRLAEEGPGENETTIRVAAMGHLMKKKCDCDLICWNQRNCSGFLQL